MTYNPTAKNREEIHQEALVIATSHKRSGLAISMRVGKTRIGLNYLDHFLEIRPIKALVVAPSLPIFESWKQEAEKIGKGYLLDVIDFSTYISLNKNNLNDYDILILDECHSLLFSHAENLETFQGQILGLTGTPPRYKSSEKGQMIGRFCPIVYSYLVTNAMEDNILNKCDITVHMLELSSLRNYEVKTKNGGRFYTSEKNSYDYWKTKYEEVRAEKKLLQEKRMIVYFRKDLTDFQKLDLITGIDKQISALTDEVLKMSIILMKNMMNFPSKENYTMRLKRSIEGKSLIFANTQLQADRICEHSYHGANKNSVENLELLRSGKINQMSCVLQLNEGITIPGLKEAIIMHAYGNERKTAQRLSRTLNLNPDEISRVHILCYRDTVDEKWVQSALKDFNPDRITYYYEKENIYVPELLNTVEED